MRLLMTIGLALLVGGAYAQYSTFDQLVPIAVYHGKGGSQGTTPARFPPRASVQKSDLCKPTPCGPNTECKIHAKGFAQCTCLEGFIPDRNTIIGCKPQCVSDDDCPSEFRCQGTTCVRVCVDGACGINAECHSRNHRAVCQCPENFIGSPNVHCHKVEVRQIADPCSPSPCGLDAECHVRRDRRGDQRPLCTCPNGYVGDPTTRCRRGDCTEDNDCPRHLACQRFQCVDPCLGFCGSGAECNARNGRPVCSCPSGFSGDPYTRCTRLPPDYQCKPSPCGANTNCKVRNDIAVCSCIENYIGNPFTGCRPECVTDRDCPHNMGCRNNICVNPCLDACGKGAQCEVRNGRASCSCPQYYQGDPYTRCYAECTSHDQCLSYKACVKLQCVDPCKDACGTGANCKVKDHTPICSCPKGYTGHPYHSCTPRPITRADLCEPNPCGFQAECTKGFDHSGNDRPVCSCPTGYNGNPLVSCQRGECQVHDDCPNNQACYSFTCQNPCYTQDRHRAFNYGSVCGHNADCSVRNHQPVCSCPPGYVGNPILECYVSNRRRSFSYRSGKRK